VIRSVGKKTAERRVLLLLDILSLSFANSLYYYFRIRSGFFHVITIPDFWGPVLMLSFFMVFLFWFWGLYKFSYLSSRLDEFISVLKISTLGVLIIFFAIFFDDATSGKAPHVRAFVVFYWFVIVVSVGVTRIIFRTVQKRLLLNGIGLRNAVIVGCGERACSVFNLAKKYKTLGYEPLGFISLDKGNKYDGLPAPLLSDISRLSETLEELKATEVIIALEEKEKEKIYGIISSVNGADASIKIVPDLYDSIAGQAHASQLYGFPLIDVVPQLMPEWQMATKRLLDVVVSGIALLVGIPLWLIIAAAIRINSRGPIIYKQERAGKDVRSFTLFKFRSMYIDAEKTTGPVWAAKNDPRVTAIGRILRKTHLDETPQFFNVLKGEMSLVGPRPERPFFVEKLSKEIPLYKRRYKIKPGLTGLARVKYKYDESIEDVKIDLQYDLYYIENMSLRLDFQILFWTISHVLLGKGHA
jgi:exopolysaccharide biosynthesis polyprenyl glycosylphosphotransferase